MTKRDDGGPAFPVAHVHDTHDQDMGDGIDTTIIPGMSLLDWFAGQALFGLIASYAHPDVDAAKPVMLTETAQNAWMLADAMLAEKRRQESEAKP